MTLLGFCEEDEYLPDYGTIVLREVYRDKTLPALDNELLGENATAALSGTVATAGDGWLHATAGHSYQAIRCEAHDGPPELRLGSWEDIVESPFRSRSGIAGLGWLTGGTLSGELNLGAKGFYRVRVCRKTAEAGEEGDIWLFQFWPAEVPEPPRWLKRTRPAVRREDPGWQQVFGYQAIEVSWYFTLVGMPRPDGWLDEPLSGEPEPSDRVCAQLGVDPPRTRRDAIPLLVAAGLLVADGTGGYSAGTPRRATEVLDLPAELAARLDAAAVRAKYAWLAADLVSIAAWSNPAQVKDLAALLAVPEETIEPLLEYAVSDRLIRRENVAVAPLPRPPLRTEPVPRVKIVRGEEPATVAGAPPKAGFVSADGTVVVWRSGEPAVLGRVESDYRYRAFETLAGIYVAASGGQGHLIDWAGAAGRLPVDLGFFPVRSTDGRYLAGVETHVGRRTWDQVHLFDVATEKAWSLPKSDELTRSVLGIHDGAVCFTTRLPDGTFASFRWTPGEEPVELASPVHRLDSLSGAQVREETGGTVAVTAPGERRELPQPHRWRFVPGGTRMFSFRGDPPIVELLDLATGTTAEHAMPDGCDVGDTPPTSPIWETPDTLVFSQPHRGSTRRVIRWDSARNAFEHFDLPEIAGYRPFLIEPVLVREDTPGRRPRGDDPERLPDAGARTQVQR
ncbi:DUF6042 family protein [Amycolatopsis circi]|uniref:DUF6042 family protein n=1 Tax=Amycolatopsis circi TaxID=871959 RepID=UPI000E27AEFA|nr:DUF6042 family protein [Amycolatopsis circi]